MIYYIKRRIDQNWKIVDVINTVVDNIVGKDVKKKFREKLERYERIAQFSPNPMAHHVLTGDYVLTTSIDYRAKALAKGKVKHPKKHKKIGSSR